MLGSLLLIVMMATSFAAGYCTRSLVSHRRRTKYIKWEPYVRPSRSSQPPQFLMRSGDRSVASLKRFASGSSRNS